MKKTLSAWFVFQLFVINSQVLQVSNTMTPEQLVQNVLVGSGLQVSNVLFNGQPANAIDMQCGSFDGTNTNVGLTAGVIMASGSIDVAPGPNDSDGASDGFASVVISDPDLDAISTNTLNDLAVLEFDFVPTGNTVSFRYVFSSEEYNEYVCSQFNDVFGFFISGPGISGPFTNGAENIARIPGTTTAVAINTVNLGVAGINGDASTCEGIDPNWESYNIYYNNNTQSSVQYDGMTQVLTAFSPVQCGLTYHLKIAVADAGDGAFDSGVFLEANSLSVSGVNLDLTTVTGSSTVYEGTCSVADFVLSRPGCFIDQPLTLTYSFSGTATENLDYTVAPAGNSVTFQPFEDTIILSLAGIVETPNLVESNETIIFTATYVNSLGITDTISDTLIMSEQPIIAANSNDPLIICPEDSVLLTVEAVGGTAPYVYTWQDGQTGDTAFFSMLSPGVQSIDVTILDFCGFTFFHTIPITYPDPGPLTFVPQNVTVFCPTDLVTMTASAINGVAPYSFSWSTGDTGTSITDSIHVNNTTKTYTVTVTDACGFTNQGVTTLTLNQTLDIDNLSPTASQLCVDNGTITPTVVGETGTIQYAWKGPAPDTNTITNTEIHANVPPGWYYLTVTDDVCSDRDSIFVDSIPSPVASFHFVDPSGDPPVNIVFHNTSINANLYEWDFGNGDTALVNTLSDQDGIYLDTGTYFVTLKASNSPCSSTVTHSFTIVFEPKVTITDIFSPNGDSKNDKFSIKPMFFGEFTIQIFNRWGTLMFEGDKDNPDWDGKAPSGKDATEGVYFFKYKGTGYSGTVLEGHGNLQLTR